MDYMIRYIYQVVLMEEIPSLIAITSVCSNPATLLPTQQLSLSSYKTLKCGTETPEVVRRSIPTLRKSGTLIDSFIRKRNGYAVVPI